MIRLLCLILLCGVVQPWAVRGVSLGTEKVPVHEVYTSGPSCSVQSPPVSPSVINCGPNTTATLEYAQTIAWKFAPVLKFHPLEQYHLQVCIHAVCTRSGSLERLMMWIECRIWMSGMMLQQCF